MSNSLILDSLDIHNFRRFRKLRIERLARINLIVGKNNVGKTTLLEALQIYASRAEYQALWQLLETRRESVPLQHLDKMNVKERFDTLKYLFYGRQDIPLYPVNNLPSPIKIAPLASPDESLSLALEWYKMVYNPELSTLDLQPLPADEFKRVQAPIPALVRRVGSYKAIYRLDQDTHPLFGAEPDTIKHLYLSSQSLPDDTLAFLRDQAVVFSLYDYVNEALRLLVPELEWADLRIKKYGKGEDEEQLRKIGKLKGEQRLIPFTSFGEGVNRLFEIALALVNAQDGILLLDEIENGLHYSILPDVWRFIFKVANKLNVQIFATSHRWECVEAFGKAAPKNEQEESLLISLRKHQFEEGVVAAVLFDEEEFDIISHERIEVR